MKWIFTDFPKVFKASMSFVESTGKGDARPEKFKTKSIPANDAVIVATQEIV